MNTEERIKALQNVGYDVDESRFLAIAALHSGYFLRRQFLTFVGGTKGWKDVALLNKLKSNRHCRTLVLRHSRMIYHLSAKPLYEALGEKDNRNRREHQPSTIKNKIMTLDFVLEHSGYRYLVTETEKLGYFIGALRMPTEDLPTRWYESPRGRAASAKYFADKSPIFLSEESSQTAPAMHFGYVDEGTQSTDRFETYLRQYGRLLAALPDFRMIYIAQHDGLMERATRVFEKFAASLGPTAGSIDSETRRLIDYFEMRQEYEAGDFSQFDTARLIRYREAKRTFGGERWDALYTQWQTHGASAVLANLHPGQDQHRGPVRQFTTCILGHDYELFGTLTNGTLHSVAAEVQTDA